MENDLYINFGKLLAHQRTIHGFSRSEIAEKLDITKNSYGQYERGERRVPLAHIMTLSTLLEFDINEFFDSQRDRAVSETVARRHDWDVEFGSVHWEEEEIEEIKMFARYLLSKRGK